MVKIAVVGTGYVGLVTGVCLAEIGHTVICSDISEEKINLLNKGKMPIHEDGLSDKVLRNVKEERLSFTTNIDKAIQDSEVIFSAVGTPPDKDHKADLQFVREVAKTFAKNLNSYKVFVNKSTVPVGTGEMVKEIISEFAKGKEFDVVSNPEFLREGAAIKDFLQPDRIVIGHESNKAKELMQKIYSPLERTQSPILFTDIKSAELIKYAANSMLAVRISFANEMSKYCDLIGANVKSVMRGMGLDNRIGPRFLNAGIGYGGSCFPKDVDALIESGKEVGYEFKIISAAKFANGEQKSYLIEKIEKEINFKGKTFAIWGLSFKPRTDDVRETPARIIIQELLEKEASVKVFDPISIENFKKSYPEFNSNSRVEFVESNYQALENVDGLILVTEWDEFRTIDYERAKKLMRGNLIADGRNIYNSNEVRENGFKYIGIGVDN
ncbi:MAG: UDP-glucose dehydrogenase family protein [Nanoarchaeota archaeon]